MWGIQEVFDLFRQQTAESGHLRILGRLSLGLQARTQGCNFSILYRWEPCWISDLGCLTGSLSSGNSPDFKSQSVSLGRLGSSRGALLFETNVQVIQTQPQHGEPLFHACVAPACSPPPDASPTTLTSCFDDPHTWVFNLPILTSINTLVVFQLAKCVSLNRCWQHQHKYKNQCFRHIGLWLDYGAPP